MDRLPYELVDAILKAYVYSEFKNDVLELRLVCRLFDRILKPFVCRTLELEFSRLNKASTKPRPQTDALQTIGYHCKSLYIDMMVLRDDVEVNFLNTVFARVPAMEVFCQSLQKYCMSDATFTEMEYFNAVDSLLFNCREIERLRLNLPFQLVGRHCSATTIVLANTFKALAERHEQDPVSLKVMVLENVTDVALCSLWLNPSDIKNIMKTVAVLEHLVITLRRHSTEAERVDVFGSCFWNVIERAQHLQSLCIVGMDHDDRPHRGVKQTKYFHMPLDDWRWRGLPAPRLMLNNLTCLELKRLEITPEAMFQLSEEFGETLQEIYLNEVYLKAEQSSDWNEDSQKVLWVGVPNERPGFGCRWIAIVLRYFARHLRICRASFLTYDQYLMDDIEANLKFDFTGPCGLGRSVSQRFVEVVMGVRQPNTPSGQPVEFLPPDSKYDWMLDQLIDRQPHWKVTDYDTNAYQIAVENTTSSWQKSIDGVFTNCNANTLDELHYIAETASHGMNEVQQRRNGWTTASGLANDDDHEDMDEDEDDDMDDDEDDYDEDGDDEDDFDEDEELVDAD